jgi:ribosomal-protein-alanine N-acetyltransferase
MPSSLGKEAPVSTGQSPRQALRVQIRWMIRRDMHEVLRIERDSFEYHWSEEDFLCCLRQRNCIGMVAEHENQVVGFMIYELYKSKLHVLNFAVAPWARRSGVGTQMIEKLVNKLSQQRRKLISLEVRETNLAAQLFFQRLGFRAISVLRDHYQDTSEDAYLMHFRIDGNEEAEAFAPLNRIAKYEDV